MRRIYINEKQLKKCIQTLQEIDLNGDSALATTKDANRAAQQTIKNAKDSGVNTETEPANVAFSADALKKAGIQENQIVKRITKKNFRK